MWQSCHTKEILGSAEHFLTIPQEQVFPAWSSVQNPPSGEIPSMILVGPYSWIEDIMHTPLQRWIWLCLAGHIVMSLRRATP